MLSKVNSLKRKLRVQCPCGYVFDGLSDMGDAIIRVRSHFELFHKDFLPFGITNAEVLALLKKDRKKRNQEDSPGHFSHHMQNSPLTH